MSSPRNSNNNSSSNKNSLLEGPWAKGFFVLASFGLLVFFVASASQGTSTATQSIANMEKPVDTVTVKTAGGSSAGHLMHGTVGDVPYYHCGAAHGEEKRDIILLHGAKFTKEDWKRSTILSRLCGASSRLSVTALDLPVSADAQQLQSVLQGLAVGEGLILPEGNYVVVTPSASGATIVDWINNGDIDDLMESVGLWIPIASPAIQKAKEEQLKLLRKQSWPILALYGDQDMPGKKVSERLQNSAGARVKQFPGPHPFYLEIPEYFVRYLLNELNAA